MSSSQTSNTAQGNYPPPGDTTSEGGYGGQGVQAFASVSQRGLVDQTTDGQPLGNELEDAYQGTDEVASRKFREEQSGNQPGAQPALNPYGDSLETRGEAKERLTQGATDMRARTYQDEILDRNDQ
ncbi:uncharacterized protein FOMMEDRAFT_165176 [Fomitiporia mediterranea MF3/22]|uniref:uncharacterized protein n=1 Tax=Fomitiporia mediterranea (strain MF3/22) TaxID=694068 RepID=UPI0004407C6A|nr:uncharacterized protein FOMMEDRAFT_165176 [Fomitiporia mediterranea MF3/22]EJD06335.1 hypothetical protein FOMMEDRAFT_165176 [Fomitiporia mediterranea MF3/22]